MNNLSSALFIETLKMHRSKVSFFSALGFTIMPIAGGLFMIILKDPQAAKSMGLISAKAQLMVGVADWPAYLSFLLQAAAAGGMVIFSILTSWVFGREFSDHTVKELLASPTSRSSIVAAKFVVISMWSLGITVIAFGISLAVGYFIVLPGWSMELLGSTFTGMMGCAFLTLGLIPWVALLASSGRGYLPAFGWIILTLVLANLAAILGWGDRFPWAIPGLFSGAAGPRSDMLGAHSYFILLVTFLIGLAATFWWWLEADQTR